MAPCIATWALEYLDLHVSDHSFPDPCHYSALLFSFLKIYMFIYLDKLNLNKLNTLAEFEGSI